MIQEGDVLRPSGWAIANCKWWRNKEYKVERMHDYIGIRASDGDFYDIERLEQNGYLTEESGRCFIFVNFSLENE
ncbi:hypothetical protein [Citrobacter phage CVT22]|uniref:Uncharacterized protein n=1 Tax=Citrobacter phage CVT22 TaxID=1622234 RepID=A0A0R6CPY7_9CAUD|nr:hypothetical protein APL39_gp68 [Citrobacter phage CVT22]AJT60772.1 hypothetical protein [Citrobacter phage CVT22]